MPTMQTTEGVGLELLARIGQGAIGEVWRGRYEDDGTEVAVKLLHNLHNRPEARSSFVQEVRSQARLQHPGVVQVLGYGESAEQLRLEKEMRIPTGTPYLSMELAKFGTLRHVEGPHSWRELETFLRQILDTLAYAHARRMVHRDLKPDNILLCSEESAEHAGEFYRYKLTDFGIAHAINISSRRESHEVFQPEAGTPYYMAPEQIRGEWRKFGAWTDLYAVGALAFELSSGVPPFQGDDVVTISMGHLSEPVPSLDPQFPVPDRFEDWLQALLAKEVTDRFRSAADATWALEQLETLDTGHPNTQPDDAERERSTDVPSPSSKTIVEQQTTMAMTDAMSHTETLHYARMEDESSGVPQWKGSSATEFELPPLPGSWRDDTTTSPRPVPRISEKLFKLRRVPYVGREEERDVLWNALCEVHRTGRSRAVLIQGPPGMGKTRLAEWLGHRIMELSQSVYLQTSFRPEGVGESELAYIGRSWFRAWGLERDEAVEQIQTKLETVIAPEMSEEELESITEYVERVIFDLPSDTFLTGQGSESREKALDLVTAIFRELPLLRPAYLVFDNAQWSKFAPGVVRNLIDEPASAPVLFAMTYYQSGDQEEDPESARALEEVRRSSSTDVLTLEALSDSTVAQLVQQRIDLEPSTAELLVDLADGYPRVALEHLERWVACDNLVETPEGYRVKTLADVKERRRS